MNTTKHRSPPNVAALRNALFTGYLLPNADGTGIFMRLGTHHVRCFAGIAQIRSLVKSKMIEQIGVEDVMGLPVYRLTPKGKRKAKQFVNKESE